MQVSQKLPAVNDLIAILEENGFECHLRHTTLADISDEPIFYGGDENMPLSHETAFIIRDGFSSENYFSDAEGYAYCSTKDLFCRTRGTLIAFTRAMESLSEYIGRAKMKEMFCS